MSVDVVRVPERGRVDVTQVEWRNLASAPAFWSLVEKGIISVEHPSANRVRLVGTCYVGRAIIDDVVVEVHEKVEGALAALLAHATRASFRVEKLAAPASELGPLIGLLAAQFVEALRRYVSRGREFFYRREKRVGSLVGGKVDVTGTIRLHARGLRHLVQFEKNTVAHNTPFNRVALAALREVDRLSRLVPVDRDAVAHARALAILFSDCRDTSVLFGARSEMVRLAQGLEAETKDSARRDLLALSMLLLAHESFEHTASTGSASPRAWFLNLETLFEAAVRNTMDFVVGPGARVSAGRDAPMPIFPATPIKEYRANPDLVVRTGSTAAAVGDVKYKAIDEGPAASDIYQLLVHATAFGSAEAFLVYPSDSFSCTDLGVSTAGPRVRVFAVDARDLADHMGRVLDVLGVPKSVPASTGAAA
ncbi:MAG TPA: hypothetical protein PK329_02570 [Myxococcota bacterium]|jgi:5-methylcytosine-specific restriction endonuclease McrBC regulatory subunit McrC|nr:hypothetical protein [Myxococcota bacterium]HPC92072.1 hypothetical protein [Myxococcota bacterium]HPL24296.1 hypothetical protein [Myxococcota bacterium]HQE72898.1 hypothetical protein [Myxococcota bacterium]HRR73345.1 hypothetical protein [Myxococcota bacterium]